MTENFLEKIFEHNNWANLRILEACSTLTDELVAAIAEQYSLRLDPLTDVRGSASYRKEMIRVFVKRALEEVRNDR